MANNTIFMSPSVVWSTLSELYKSIEFDEDVVIGLCATLEVDHIKDITLMQPFQGIGIEKINGLVKVPCNVFRILDIYEANENPLTAANNGSYLYNLQDKYGNAPDDGDIIYLNYKGIHVDNDGIPQIVTWHQEACETYCKIKILEEAVGMGKFKESMYERWLMMLPGQISAAKNNFRHKTRKEVDDLNIIRYNMIVKIHNLPIQQKMMRDGS